MVQQPGRPSGPGALVVRAAPPELAGVFAAALASDLRPADRRELEALGAEPRAAIEHALRASREAWAALRADGALIALFGVAADPENPQIGAPWMLATPLLESAARPFLRACGDWVERLQSGFDLLTNRVDARNRVHIAWLRWCGFAFLRRVPLGPERREFLEFVRLAGGAVPPIPGRRVPHKRKENGHVRSHGDRPRP